LRRLRGRYGIAAGDRQAKTTCRPPPDPAAPRDSNVDNGRGRAGEIRSDGGFVSLAPPRPNEDEIAFAPDPEPPLGRQGGFHELAREKAIVQTSVLPLRPPSGDDLTVSEGRLRALKRLF